MERGPVVKITATELRAIIAYHRQRVSADRRADRMEPGTITTVRRYCAALQRMAKACKTITSRHRARRLRVGVRL
jgi:hypothetical protein